MWNFVDLFVWVLGRLFVMGLGLLSASEVLLDQVSVSRLGLVFVFQLDLE